MIAVSQERLVADWEALSGFRDPTQPGWTRRPFTPEYAAARAWLAERMLDAGLEVRLDTAANLVGRLPGRQDLPPIVVGSHVDTVAGGGRFDGTIGVLGGLEIARGLAEAGITLDHPLEVVDFLAEEPTDFGLSCVGSRAWAGALDDGMLARHDPSGRTLAEALAAAGGQPGRLAEARRQRGSVACYLELHIEQGPVLEREGLHVGVVTGITGIARLRVTLEGRADHAGTMPMADRKDALAGAAELTLALERLWADGRGVGTVGRLTVEPNATNVVPGRAELWAEMRSVDAVALEERGAAFAAVARDVTAGRGLGCVYEPVSAEEPTPVSAEMQAHLAAALATLGLPDRRLPSYAGHDGAQVAKLAPIGMLFVPSRDGRSHCPEEWTEHADVTLGVAALGQAALRLDTQG